MKQSKFIVSIVLFCVILTGLVYAQPQEVSQKPPTSKEELLQRFEQALRANDKDAVRRLCYWDGINPVNRSFEIKMFDNFSSSEIELRGFEFKPLPKDFPAEYVRSGVRHHPNLPIDGFISVKYYQKSNDLKGTWSWPYGKLENYFYFTSVIEEIVDESVPNDKHLCVRINGNCFPEPVKFKGEYTCVHNQKDIHQLFEGECNLIKCYYGQYIKSCKVQKISQEGSIQLIISVDNKIIYESEKQETKQPIIYEQTISDN